jgi:hypothetical protein
MAQDIRKMLQEQAPETSKLSEGHEARFEALLAESFSNKKENHSFFWMKIAAVGILLLSLGYFGYQQLSNDDELETQIAETVVDRQDDKQQFTLGDISPDLKKVEDFYLTGIDVQLASLKITDDNKELMDGYLLRIGELDKEYKLLNKELNDVGPSEASVNALIDNLKLRLELLFKLKNKLKELKNIENEEFSSMQS